MKNYYLVVTSALTGATPDEFTYSLEHHWIDLGGGLAAVVARFGSEGAEMRFSAHPAVTPLPHILSSETLHPLHLAALNALFPNLKPTHKTFDLAQEIGKIHPAFRPTVF